MERTVERVSLEELKEIGVEKKIICRLIPQHGFHDAVKRMPHFELGDMYVVYSILLDKCEDGIGTVPLMNDLVEILEIEKEKLYNLARENANELLPPKVASLDDFLRESEYYDEVDMEGMDENFGNHMYVITNDVQTYGAAAVLYKDVLKSLADRIESNLFLLPSSVHEFIAVPITDAMNVKELEELVKSVNYSVLEPKDFLSDSVYYYDRVADELTRVEGLC
ncbi:MAG: DUF5688 family protein [Lachnospiraceae bacterium]|nr:DUF5688 family protein [Lachnospiraceae bacterium]